MKTIIHNVYLFDELDDEAKEQAIYDHIIFWLDTNLLGDGSDNFKRACKEAEEMQTPWFTLNYIYDYCKDEIIEEIKDNDYYFYKNGTIV